MHKPTSDEFCLFLNLCIYVRKFVSNYHSYSQTEVLRANISGNLDTPEGGFDAIMQAIACKVS